MSRSCRLVTACCLFAARPALGGEPRVHDGFYARGAVGVGGLGVRTSSRAGTTGTSGSGLSFELSAGGNASTQLVLGGTWLNITALRSAYRAPDGTRSDLGHAQYLSAAGPSLSIYPDPSNGMSFGVMAGGAWLRADDANGDRVAHSSRRGAVASLSFGYEWFVADQLSFGALVRGTGGRLWTRDRIAGQESTGDDRLVSMSLAFSVTYH